MVVCKVPVAMGRRASSGCLMFITRTHIIYTIKRLHYDSTVSVLTMTMTNWPWPWLWVTSMTLQCLKTVLSFLQPKALQSWFEGWPGKESQTFDSCSLFLLPQECCLPSGQEWEGRLLLWWWLWDTFNLLQLVVVELSPIKGQWRQPVNCRQ